MALWAGNWKPVRMNQRTEGFQTSGLATRLGAATLLVLSNACSSEGIGTNVALMSSATRATIQTRICPGPKAQAQLLRALFQAQEGDVIRLCPGRYEFDREIPLHDKRGITLAGAGRDATRISFAGSQDAWGLSAGRMRGFTLQGLTVEDAPSVGIFIYESSQLTLRDVRVQWSGHDSCDPSPTALVDPCSAHGEVGASIDFSDNILIEDAEFHGAAVFGLIMLMPRDALVRRIRATHNSVGMLYSEAHRTTVMDSHFEANAIGLLMGDAPENNPHGAKSRLINNRIIANNRPNFAPAGNELAALPAGVGLLLAAGDQVEMAANEFIDNGATGLIIINAGLATPNEDETKFDFYPEGLNIHHNLFRDNGGEPPPADPRALPISAFLPLVIAKNGGKSAQIAWDGAVDAPNDCSQVPTDERGVPLNQPNPDSPRSEPRSDERGRPNFEEGDPSPPCRWNAWKFDAQGQLKPENQLYIDNNRFESTRPQTALVDDFVRFNVRSSDPEQLSRDMLVPVSHDLAAHAGTPASWPDGAPDLPYVVDPRSAGNRVSPAQTAQVCAGGSPGQVNWSALARHNCPLLSDYGLFADPQDPRHSPQARGMRYKLNTPLFSDYAVKYRFVFVPPGRAIGYADYAGDPAVAWDNNPQRALDLPVGSVLVKTFAFRQQDAAGKTTDENVVETRLLIKRQQYDRVLWVGMAYRWRDSAAGRVAELLPEGATTPVSFDYLDEDPQVVDAAGQRRRYTGATAHYAIPAATSCAACHGGTHREPGASPISAKPRHLNRDADCAATGSRLNQLDCLVASGLMDPLPDVPAMLERFARWNVPGDSGAPADSPQDVHQRMRAYLEINCAYCHSADGRARFTDMYVDAFRPVDKRFGICRPPNLGGRFGNRRFDIEPGNAEASVLHHRDTIGSFLRMPPLARSITNREAAELMVDWIDRALIDPSVEVHDVEKCSEGGPPLR